MWCCVYCSGWSDLCEGGGVRLGVDGLWRTADHLESLSDVCGKGQKEAQLLGAEFAAKLCCTNVVLLLSLQLSVCKDLQLPSSEFAYSADLISITSSSPLESAPTQVSSCISEHYHQWRFVMQTWMQMCFSQAISALAVSPDGSARFWPSLAHDGTYTEMSLDLGGHVCNYVAAVKVCNQAERGVQKLISLLGLDSNSISIHITI